MKNNLFIIGLFLIGDLFLVKAQRYLPEQIGFQLSLGAIDEFKLFHKEDHKGGSLNLFEFHLYSGVYWHTMERNKWGTGFQFTRKRLEQEPKQSEFYAVDQYIIDASYWSMLFSNKKKNFFFGLGVGVNIGYEWSYRNMLFELNYNDLLESEKNKFAAKGSDEDCRKQKFYEMKNIHLGTKGEDKKEELVKIKNRFLYGALVGAEAEVFLANQFALLFNTKLRYLRKSFTNDFQFNYGVGFKYILNY